MPQLERKRSQDQIEEKPQGASSPSRLEELRKIHRFDSDQSPHKSSDQQARTNEASTSGLDGQIMIWETSDDELLRQADAHYKQGEYKKAVQLNKYVIDNYEQKPQPDGRNMILALDGLAKVWEEQGRHEDAEALHVFVIDKYAQANQQDDLKIVQAVNDLAKVWEKQGKDKEAKALYKCAFLFYNKMFKENDSRTALAMNGMAEVYEKLGRYDKAKAYYEYVLPICKKEFGESDPRTEKVRKNLTELPEKSGQEDQSGAIKRLIAKNLVNSILSHIKYYKRFPDICNPTLFNDKVLHRNLFDRRPIRNQFADKYAVREYVKDRIGEEYLPKLYHVSTDPSTIPFEELPNKFVIKSNQGSGRVTLVRDKSTLDKAEITNIIKECNDWLSQDYYPGSGEWPHKHTTQLIMIEEFIEDGNGSSPIDYKLYTTNSEGRFFQVDTDLFEHHKRDIYDTQWNRLPVKKSGHDNNPTPLPRPQHLEQMLELAQKLGKGIDFARIDFYDTPERVFLGEMTNLPGLTPDGGSHFEPAMHERIFGEGWEVYNKCSIQSLPPSSEVCQIMHQIIRGMHKLVLEGGKETGSIPKKDTTSFSKGRVL